MAPKSAKRAASTAKVAAAGPVAKAPKQEAACPKLAAVTEVVQQADGLPQACREMLCAALAPAFGVPANERHEVEMRVVAAVGEVMEKTRSRMQAVIESEAGKVVSLDAKKEELEKAITDAKAQVMAAAAAESEKDAELVSAKRVVDEKARVLAHAKAAETEGNVAFEKAKVDMQAVQLVHDRHFRALRDDELEAAEAQCHLDSLCQSVAHAGLDTSLLSTLPSACLKPKASRGQFDNVILDELEKSLLDRIKCLSERVAAESPAASERQTAVAEAQRLVDAAEKEAEAVFGACREAKARHQEALESEATAVAALAAFAAEYREATQAREASKGALEQFEEGAAAAFVQLRDAASTEKKEESTVTSLAQEGMVGGA